jgi:dipeptidyl aminopeptidase/acylaminoacyl peptidase
MPAYLNRGATYTDEPSLPEDPFIDLLAQTNAKVEHFDISPDGKCIAYVSALSGGFDLWICDISGSNRKRLVIMYPEEALNPSWSPDGEWIAYTARGNAFKVRSDGSEPPINLTYGMGPAHGHEFIRWTPTGDRIVFIHSNSNGYNQVVSASTDIPTGKVNLNWITNENFNSTDVHISPDGSSVCFMSDRSGFADFKRMDVWTAPITGGDAINMTPNTLTHYDYRPRWSSDGKSLVFTSDRSGFRKVGTIDIKTRETTFITDNNSYDEYNPRWSPDGEWIAYSVNINWDFQLFIVKSDGSQLPIQLTYDSGIHGGMDAYQVRGTIRWSPDSKDIFFTHMSHEKCSDIYLMSITDTIKKQITDHMPNDLKKHKFAKPELIYYKSIDNLEIPAWLYRPIDSQNKRTPLVIYARANTKGLHVNGFYPYIQAWIDRGYSVVAPLVRGSAGLGKKYEFLNFGDWGGGDIDDFAYSVVHLEKQGLIDVDKVVMHGGSTGGFFTLSMIHRYPDLLKAAVCFYGPPDLIHMWDYRNGSSKPVLGDVVAGDRGGPDMAPTHWKNRSLIYNLDKVKTPLMLLWGDRDGVRISMVDDYFRAAKERQLYTEYIQYNCEPHGWYHWRPENVRDSMRRMAGHFKKFTGT